MARDGQTAKAARLEKLAAELDRLEDFLGRHTARETRRTQWPAEWSEIEARHPVAPKKTKMTLHVDEDVAGWFRAQGRGYQARVNAVLRAYMLARKSDVV